MCIYSTLTNLNKHIPILGKGGKCLILPPGYKDKVPSGYIPLPSDTFENYALLRSVLKSSKAEDIAEAVTYGKKVKLYPLSQASNPKPTTFMDMQGKLFDATITYDLRYFESLNRIIQAEPWLQRDRGFIDGLVSIGIKKGQPSAFIDLRTVFDAYSLRRLN